MQNTRKGLHKVFKAVVNETSQFLPIFSEYGSKVSYIIPEPVNFSEVNRLSSDIKKSLLKATLREIKTRINNHILLVQDPEKDKPVTPCMNV